MKPTLQDQMNFSAEQAISHGLIPEVRDGSLWKMVSLRTSLGRQFTNNTPIGYKNPATKWVKQSMIAMVYNVKYRKVKPTPKTPKQVWCIEFDLLIDEQVVEGLFLWDDEWDSCMKKAAEIEANIDWKDSKW